MMENEYQLRVELIDTQRQLADPQAEIAQLKKEIKRLRNALAGGIRFDPAKYYCIYCGSTGPEKSAIKHDMQCPHWHS